MQAGDGGYMTRTPPPTHTQSKLHKYLHTDEVIVILAAYHSTLEYRLSALIWGYAHANWMNGIGSVALFMWSTFLWDQK